MFPVDKMSLYEAHVTAVTISPTLHLGSHGNSGADEKTRRQESPKIFHRLTMFS